MSPHLLDWELCFWGCGGPARRSSPSAACRPGDYRLSPQRHRLPGAAWRWPALNVLQLVRAAAPPAMRAPTPHVNVRGPWEREGRGGSGCGVSGGAAPQ